MSDAKPAAGSPSLAHRLGAATGAAVGSGVGVWMAWCVSIAAHIPLTTLLGTIIVIGAAYDAWRGR